MIDRDTINRIHSISREVTNCILSVLGPSDFVKMQKEGRAALSLQRLKRLEAWERRTGLEMS